MGINLGSATAYLMLDTSNFDKGMLTASQQLNGFNKAGATTGDKLQSVGNSMKTAGKTMSTNFTLPLVAAGTAIWKVSADFEQGMANVRQLSGATGEDFEELSAKARQMGKDTEFSATQATEALGYMALAGWDTKDMIAGISPVMDLATVSMEDLGTVSDILTDAITAFGHTAHDQTEYVDEFGNGVNYAEHFADILAKTSAKSNTTVSQLGEAFKYCAPAAGSLGYEAEDVALALGLMANNGIKATQGGTSLRRLLLNMIDPSSDAAAIMDKYNLSLFNADGSAKDFGTVLDMLRESFKGTGSMTEEQVMQLSNLDDQFRSGAITEAEYDAAAQQLIESFGLLTDQEKANAAATLAGATGLSGFLAIVNSSEEDFAKLRNEIENCNGATKEMAETMRDTAEVKLSILLSKLAELGLSLGESLVPIIEKIIEFIGKWIDRFNELDPKIQELIVNLALFLAAAGPVLTVIGNIVSICSVVFGWIGSIIGLLSGAGGLLGVLGSLGSTLGGIFAAVSAFIAANPVAIFIAAIIAAVAAAVVAIIKNWDEIKQAASDLWESIQETFSNVSKWFKEKFTEAKEAVVDAWGDIQERFTEILEKIKGVFESVQDWFKEKFTEAKEAVIQVWENIKEEFAEVYQKIKDVFSDVKEWFKEKFESAKEGIKEAWENIGEFFGEKLNAIKEIFNNAKSWFKEIGSGIVNSILNGIQSAWSTLTGWVSSGINALRNSFSIVGSGKSKGSYATGLDYVPSNGLYYLHQGESIQTKEQTKNNKPSGDTFNFFSPKALDEVSAAREMRRTKQQMALGFD